MSFTHPDGKKFVCDKEVCLGYPQGPVLQLLRPVWVLVVVLVLGSSDHLVVLPILLLALTATP